MCKMYRYGGIHLLIMTAWLWGGNVHDRRVTEWSHPVFPRIQLAPDPILPVPILDHEPPYTRGADNTISWQDSMKVVYDSLHVLQMTIQYFEAEAVISSGDTLWGYVQKNATTATFVQLPHSVPIYFRLRYYAVDRHGEMSLSPWSRAEVSVQDSAAPLITVFEIEDMQYHGEMPWVVGSKIRLRIRVEDPNGQVMQIGILEQSDGVRSEVFDNLDFRPRSVIDTTLQYPLLTDMKRPLTLSFWAVDVAEFQSDTLSRTFYWLPAESETVCFPNPFCPERDERLVIKVEKPGIEQAGIFDPFGNLIRTLKKHPTREKSFEWDGRNENNDLVAKGGYLCVVNGDRSLYCKIAVIR